MGPGMRESRAVYNKACSIIPDDREYFSVFEEKRTVLICGSAFPSPDSRGNAGCMRALDVASDCFMERPFLSEMALDNIGEIVNREVYEMQDSDKSFMCSLAMLYIFKGRTRVCPAGHASVMFYETDALKNVWVGDGTLLGSKPDHKAVYSDEFELKKDCRFILITGGSKEDVDLATDYFKENKGAVPEDTEEFLKGRQCSYANLFLPEREKRGFLR